MVPAQGEFLQDQFEGEFVVKTFINNNTDNTYMYKSGDVRILIEENRKSISLQLGGHYPHEKTGKVKSEKKTVDCVKPSSNVGEINTKRKEVLENLLGSSNDLYTAWINQFGKESIIEDNR